MTDALVEAVARAISGQDDAGWKALPQDDRERLYGGGKWHDSGHTRDDHKQSATAAIQAIEAAGYRVVPSWQGMDSAPKDGTKILVSWKAGHVSIVRWQNYGNGSFTTGGSDRCGTPDQYDESWFLGWQPLPAAMLSAAPRVGEGS